MKSNEGKQRKSSGAPCHCQWDLPFIYCSSPSGSSPAGLNRRPHCHRGCDGADVGICTTEAKIYHLWPKTANGGENGHSLAQCLSLSSFSFSFLLSWVQIPSSAPSERSKALQKFNFPSIQSRQNNVFNI